MIIGVCGTLKCEKNVNVKCEHCTYSVDCMTFRVQMFDTFSEPNFFTFRVIFFTDSVNFHI